MIQHVPFYSVCQQAQPGILLMHPQLADEVILTEELGADLYQIPCEVG